jgi:hypothetical protein
MALMFLYVFYIREMIKKGLKLFYFYITSANDVILTLVYAMETNKIYFEKEV